MYSSVWCAPCRASIDGVAGIGFQKPPVCFKEWINEFNLQATRIATGKSFGLFLREPGGSITGGAYRLDPGVAPATSAAISSYQPTCATGGHGRRLMEAVEAEARLRRCGSTPGSRLRAALFHRAQSAPARYSVGCQGFRSTGQTRSVRAGDGCSNVTGLQMPTRQRLFSGNFSFIPTYQRIAMPMSFACAGDIKLPPPPLNHHYPASYHRRSIFLHRLHKTHDRPSASIATIAAARCGGVQPPYSIVL